MSWAISHTGTKDAVRAAIAKHMAEMAEGFTEAKGNDRPEEKADVEAAAARILAAIDTLPADLNGVEVAANGSRGPGYLSLTLRVQAASLTL